MATTTPQRSVDYDCSAAMLAGTLVPHRTKQDYWLLLSPRFKLPVQVSPTLLESLQANPEQYQQLQRLHCWVSWDWEKNRTVLTVVQAFKPKPNHRDHYTVRGLVHRIENNLVLVRITPARGKAEPFEVPVIATPGCLATLEEGQRVNLTCLHRQGWLHTRHWQVIHPPQEQTLAEAS